MLTKIKNFINSKSETQKWKEKSEKYRKNSDQWEFKFNKLNRQLKAILDESDQ